MDPSNEFNEYLKQQLVEIEKFKQRLGIELGRNPLEVYSMDEIALMWITLYAIEFRKHWNERSNSTDSRR